MSNLLAQIAQGWQGNPVGMYVQGQQQQRQNRLSDLQMQNEQIEGLLNAKKLASGGIDIGQVNPRDFTAPSISKFRQSGDWNDLQRYTPPSSAIKVDEGDAFGFYHPQTSALIRRVPKNLGPSQELGYIADAAAAREGATQEQKFIWGPRIMKAQKEAEAQAKSTGEAFTELNRMKASLPGLMEVTERLGALADTATYTLFGQGFDWAAKQLGFGATQGATDRAKFTAIVDNQVLPLLRQTFGAAFTAEEGNRLRATLGDADLSPPEKKAQLKAFIEQKVRDIEAKQAEINMGNSQPISEPKTVNWGDL